MIAPVPALRIAVARLRALFRHDATADEIREELRFHVEMRADEYAQRGLDAGTARRAALRRFGNLAVIQDRGYDVRGGGVMETVLQDAKYTLRQWRRQPSFSLLAGLTLTLGIGLSTALFSVIDAALLRPLPYPNPEQLVTVVVEETGRDGRPMRFAPSMEDIRLWRTLPDIVSQAGMGRVTGVASVATAGMVVDLGAPQRVTVGQASEGFLETYGVVPLLGRSFTVDDTRGGAPAVALLSHAFWLREFGGDGAVLGRDIRIQDKPVTIVGVMPAGFYQGTAIWMPRQFEGAWLRNRGSGASVIARLRPGVTLAQARVALDGVTPRTSMMGPQAPPGRVALESMYDQATSQYGSTIGALALSVALILTIACVNVAGLMLARGATRHGELAIRAAIGAGRGRLVRQLLTESVLLALMGATAGVVLAYVALESLVALIPLSLPANSPVAINATVLAFALTLSIVTALLFGLLPALKLSRASSTIGAMLAIGGRGGAPLSKRAGQWLIGVEVALALVLMAGAGLVLRSFAKLVSVDVGFDAAQLVALEVEPLDQNAVVRRDYYVSLADALRRLPEVAAVGAIDQSGVTGGGTFGFTKADTGAAISGPMRIVLPGYHEAMGVKPLTGRLFEDADRAAGDVVLVNATAAQRYFDGNAVGHTLQVGMKDARYLRIVGVVPDIRHGGPQLRAQPEMYLLPAPNYKHASNTALAMIMRLRDGASLSADRLKHTAESLGPRVLVGRVRPAADVLSEQIMRPRHRMLLLTMLGVFGLLLTLVGIFSMTAYAVARRTREIGVRVAFGARPVEVVNAIVLDAVKPVALGLVAGLAGAYYATRLISSFLFETKPHDPPTLVAVVMVLALAAGLAAWLPARRAVGVDPVAALRAE
jgi:predicted permease